MRPSCRPRPWAAGTQANTSASASAALQRSGILISGVSAADREQADSRGESAEQDEREGEPDAAAATGERAGDGLGLGRHRRRAPSSSCARRRFGVSPGFAALPPPRPVALALVGAVAAATAAAARPSAPSRFSARAVLAPSTFLAAAGARRGRSRPESRGLAAAPAGRRHRRRARPRGTPRRPSCRAGRRPGRPGPRRPARRAASSRWRARMKSRFTLPLYGGLPERLTSLVSDTPPRPYDRHGASRRATPPLPFERLGAAPRRSRAWGWVRPGRAARLPGRRLRRRRAQPGGIAVWWMLALGCLVGAIAPALPVAPRARRRRPARRARRLELDRRRRLREPGADARRGGPDRDLPRRVAAGAVHARSPPGADRAARRRKRDRAGRRAGGALAPAAGALSGERDRRVPRRSPGTG